MVGKSRVVALVNAVLMVGVVTACGTDTLGAPKPSDAAPVDRSNIVALDAKLARAILSPATLPSWVTKRADTADRVGLQFQPACGADLESDARIVTQANATWTGVDPLPFVDETATAYDQPVAQAAVGEAVKAMSCKSYPSRVGRVYPEGSFTVPGSPSDATAAFCEREDAPQVVHRCTVLLGVGDLSCSLRTYAATPEAAQALARELFPAYRSACTTT